MGKEEGGKRGPIDGDLGRVRHNLEYQGGKCDSGGRRKDQPVEGQIFRPLDAVSTALSVRWRVTYHVLRRAKGPLGALAPSRFYLGLRRPGLRGRVRERRAQASRRRMRRLAREVIMMQIHRAKVNWWGSTKDGLLHVCNAYLDPRLCDGLSGPRGGRDGVAVGL